MESNCCKFMLSPPFSIVELDLQQVEESLTHLPPCDRSKMSCEVKLKQKSWVGCQAVLPLQQRQKRKLWWTGGGVCSAVSGRAGHLITERVLLHHHQSHAGSLLPPNRLGSCSSKRVSDMGCGLSARTLEGLG